MSPTRRRPRLRKALQARFGFAEVSRLLLGQLKVERTNQFSKTKRTALRRPAVATSTVALDARHGAFAPLLRRGGADSIRGRVLLSTFSFGARRFRRTLRLPSDRLATGKRTLVSFASLSRDFLAKPANSRGRHLEPKSQQRHVARATNPRVFHRDPRRPHRTALHAPKALSRGAGELPLTLGGGRLFSRRHSFVNLLLLPAAWARGGERLGWRGP